MSERFDILEFPLTGMRLIEASAGTGKTFSLAGLYVRLVVEKHLEVRQILVMTFTRAATQELRERIRERLAAAALIAADPGRVVSGKAEDQLTAEIIKRASRDEPRTEIARRLRDAAARMDEATISTIHAFAQVAARENAFDSALPFDRGTQVDDREVRHQAITDYWRSRVIGRAPQHAARMLEVWDSPRALIDMLEPLLDRPYAGLPADAQLVERLRATWLQDAEKLHELIAWAEVEGHLWKGRALQKAVSEYGGSGGLIQALADGITGGEREYPFVPEWIIKLSTPEEVAKLVKKGGIEDFRPYELELVQLMAQAIRLHVKLMLNDALLAVQAHINERKQAARQFSFADMIEALHQAIMDPQRGSVLCNALFETWPHALVDEFQDTDPLQYDILRRVYKGRDAGSLTMIGDPKQAIYSFRGGDVFAYLKAAQDAAACYHLDTNFRSTQAVLDGVQALFSGAGAQTQEGPFLIPQIRFSPVAGGRRQGDRVIHVDGRPLPAFNIWPLSDDEPIKTPIARQQLLEATVAEICRLLGGSVDARIVSKDEESRAVCAGDIAVLVNTNSDATEVQRRLAARGVASVCMHNSSVFASEQATDLLLLLRAADSAAHPESLRAALATPLLGRRLSDLLAMSDDLDQWQAEVAMFQSAHEAWRTRGVLAMIEPLLQKAAPRILSADDGERRMTNYLQLAELLAEAEAQTFGAGGLIRWLSEQINAPQADADGQQLRLESDEELVRIATVHKVKGLQYGIVFLPFAPFMKTRSISAPWLYHEEDEAFFGLDEQSKFAAQKEALAERLRLLYVALTRAEQACYFGWGYINETDRSALAWLLNGQDTGLDADECLARLTDCVKRAGGTSGGVMALLPLPDPLRADERIGQGAIPAGETRLDLPVRRAPWSVLSFSRMVAGGSHWAARAGSDDESQDQLPVGSIDRSDIPLRGAAFGTAVHEMLEVADARSWPQPGGSVYADQQAFVARYLRNAGLPLGEGLERTVLLDSICMMIGCTVHTPLPHIGPLASVEQDRQLVEMEFYMRLGGPSMEGCIQFLRQHGYGADLSSERTQQRLLGLMNGYVDLIVEVDGRFWVIDYKTNDLGGAKAAYDHGAMSRAVERGHYDLQYLIYLVALHRHLGRTLPEYEPARHLGGAQYLFLRGMNGLDSSTGVFVDSPEAGFVEALSGFFDGVEA